jgi:hypothetical protein
MRSDNGDLIGRKFTVAEGILHISLFQCALVFDGKAGEKAKGVLPEDWRKTLRFGPSAILIISKDNDA